MEQQSNFAKPDSGQRPQTAHTQGGPRLGSSSHFLQLIGCRKTDRDPDQKGHCFCLECVRVYIYIYAHPPHDRASWGRGRVEQ